MGDQVTPNVDVIGDGAAGPAAPAPTPQQTDGQDWESRFKGLSRVLGQRDADLAMAKGQVATFEQTIKELNSQLSAAKGTYDANALRTQEEVKTWEQKLAEKDKSLADLAAYRTKMEALKKFPDLLSLADTIPTMPDEATMTSHLEALQRVMDSAAEEKAKRLTAGMTPGPVTVIGHAPQGIGFTTVEQWTAALQEAQIANDWTRYGELDKAFQRWLSSSK
jgi:chromosome segregation ATPase